MSTTGGWLRLTCWFGERDRAGRVLLSEALAEVFATARVHSGIVLRAAGGFGERHRLRQDTTLTMSEDPSVLAMALDAEHRIRGILPQVEALQQRGMLTLERVTPLDEGLLDAPPTGLEETVRLEVNLPRHARVGRRPAYLHVVDLLRRAGVSGASVLLGVDGTLAGEREQARFFGRNQGVPSIVVSVGDVMRMRSVVPMIEAVLPEAVVTLERVVVLKRDGVLLAEPPVLAPHDPAGRPLWQRLSVHTSETQLHDGHAVHRELLRRLRRERVAGATSLRGVWGFHGDHEPHGDRFWQLGRRVPVQTVVLDVPEKVASAFAIADELTEDRGLITVEMVPGRRYADTGPLWGTGVDLADQPY